MVVPNPQQQALARQPVTNVLAIAPAGCGKTEALALRCEAVLARREVMPPKKILALTFSNKARSNLATRMERAIGRAWREYVTVTNFHGLGARVIRAHGTSLSIAPETLLPPHEGWRKQQMRELGVIDYDAVDSFERALSFAKRGLFDDGEVISRMRSSGNRAALEFEERLQTERRLDHDDVIRHGARLLQLPEIQRLYRSHFGMAVVDEVQDLSLLQFGMVRAVGGDGVTYAGDPAQGIYAFAGAEPEAVFHEIHDLEPEVVEFNLSYRSAPAVLDLVNAVASLMDATELECADPDEWPDPGHVISLERGDTVAEASAVVALVADLLEDPAMTVGIVGRRGSRSKDIRQAAENSGIDLEDWSKPTHVPPVAELISRFAREALGCEGTPTEAIDRLEELCQAAVEPVDVETRTELSIACEDLRSMVADGASPTEAIESCRQSPAPDSPVAPGVHLLTGHKGKGQEFDWVFVLGLEKGHIPDFRNTSDVELAEELRVLHVMTSRARTGVVFTYSRHTPTAYGWRASEPSPWLDHLRQHATQLDHA